MPRQIPDPYFNNFLYEIVYNASADAKARLPFKYKKILLKESTTKKWIETCHLEDAQIVLSELGVEWFMCFFDRNRIGKDARYLRDIFKKFNEDKRLAELTNIINSRTYVSSDKELAHSMGLMASTSHSRSYIQNIELARAGFHFQGFSKKLKSDATEGALSDGLAAEYLAKTVINSIASFQSCEALFKIKDIDLQILLFLYRARHTYLLFEKIRANFPHLKAAKITVALKRIDEEQFVIRHSNLSKKQYQISGLGIQKVNECLSHIIKSNAL